MKATQLIFAAAAFAAVLAGCAPQKPADTKTQPNATGTDTAPAGAAAGAPPSAKTDAGPPAVALDSIPASSKGVGFDYYGLGYSKELTYDFVQSAGTPADPGTQTIEITGTKENPVFRIVRSGSLAKIGSEDLVLKPDGVYNTNSSLGKIDPPSLAMPNDVSVGKTWTDDQSIKPEDGPAVKVKIVNKVEKTEKLTTKAGDFDCIVVSSKGQLSSGGKTTPFEGTNWYAKGVGLVKISLNTTNADGKKAESTVTLVKK